MPDPVAPRVACIGECMVELREQPDGRLSRSHGGDTLNTAAYLAQLEHFSSLLYHSIIGG